MNPKVRTMLENLYDEFHNKFKDKTKAWDRYLEFIALDNNINLIKQLHHNNEWLYNDKKFIENISKTYDANLLKSDYYDHLGEIYTERILSKNKQNNKDYFLTPMQTAFDAVKRDIPESNKELKIFDALTNTGRLLMAAYKQAPNSLLFGVEKDNRLLRIAFTNFLIHDISGYFLNANPDVHEVDISKKDGFHNWTHANTWNSQINKLRTKSVNPNYKLNLKQ